MTKYGIVEALAKQKVVEVLVCNVTGKHLAHEMRDLAQIVYEKLLTLPEEKIVGLHKSGHLRYYISHIVYNEYFSTSSRFHYDCRMRLPKIKADDY